MYVLKLLCNLVFFALSASILKRIYEKIAGKNIQQIKVLIVMFVTSALLLSELIFVQGMQIYALTFILLGVDSLIDHKNKRFVVFFAIATCIDIYTFLLFVALVCLCEKRIWKLFVKMVCVCIPTAILNLLYMTTGSSILTFADVSSIVALNEYMFLDKILICWLAYFVLVLLCLVSNKDINRDIRIKRIIYVGFMTYMAILSFSPISAGLMIYIIPFELLLLYTSGDKYDINMLLFTVIEVCLVITVYNNNGDTYYLGTLIGDLMNKVPDLSLQMVITALYVVCGVEIAYTNLPNVKNTEISFQSDRLLYSLRIIVMTLLILLPIVFVIVR